MVVSGHTCAQNRFKEEYLRKSGKVSKEVMRQSHLSEKGPAKRQSMIGPTFSNNKISSSMLAASLLTYVKKIGLKCILGKSNTIFFVSFVGLSH